MGYFVIIIFSTFLGSPPEFLPIAFKSNEDCENYLIKNVKKNYDDLHIEISQNSRFLVNSINNKFIVCKKLEYPINKKENKEIAHYKKK